MQIKYIHPLTLIFALFSVFIVSGISVAESSKTILYPFAIHAEKDLSFLQNGLSDSIESMLESEGHTVVRGASALTQDQALEKASADTYDYAICGSLTFFGDTISINAMLLDVASGATTVSLAKTITDKNLIFQEIESFATKVNASFNTTAAPHQPKPVSSEQPSVLQKDIIKSKDFNLEAVSLASGDVDGDGQNEIVFIDKTDIHVASLANNAIRVDTVIQGKRYIINLFVHIADINANGIDEIFITATHSTTRKLLSYVLEWDGKDYVKIVEKADWFFAVTKLPHTEGPVLLGQKQGLDVDVFSDTIHRLQWNAEEKAYTATDSVTLPSKKLTIYDIDAADFNGDGTVNMISYTQFDYLTAYNDSLETIWTGTEQYGGSYTYIEPVKPDENKRVYMRPRLYAGDADKDGKADIITIFNENSTTRVLPNLRSYKKGIIECLSWNALNMESLWKTQAVSGYIPDFSISDLNSDGNNELVYCVTYKTGTLISKKRTYIVVQPL